jgi:D-inositol-3-phosphate glycosyltransferase
MSTLGALATPRPIKIHVGLLTGCQDRSYAYGLAMALVEKGVCLDVIGSDEVESSEMHVTPNINFCKMLGKPRPNASLARKIGRVFLYYTRLLCYATIAGPRIFHILWNYKFEFFDRTLLMLFYKLLGKKIAITAHNVNAGRRDSNDSVLNHFTLKVQYGLADHIFVHSEKSKHELLAEFCVREQTVTVIPFGINNSVPDSDLTSAQAKQRLGVREGERAILFFGNIRPYKGLEYLLAAFQQLLTKSGNYRLIIAGQRKKGAEDYLDAIQRNVIRDDHRERIIQRIEYIPDEETELYFKAADVLVLPYKEIFQSGVLFLGYNFGLPAVATDVGSFREDVIEGRTGFMCKPCDPVDMARAIEAYFESDLFKHLHRRRQEIRDFAKQRHSWEIVGEKTQNIYAKLLGGNL